MPPGWSANQRSCPTNSIRLLPVSAPRDFRRSSSSACRRAWTAWRDIWERQQTQVAVDTQANFEYVQNLVVRPLTYGAPAFAAMVEECFPAAALHDEAVYFDAVGDPARLAEHQRLMMESCARFIDFDRIDCIPTSQYDVARFGG